MAIHNAFSGWLLNPADREALIARFPPRYPDVVAEYVTMKFGDHTTRPLTETEGQVVGEADDGAGVQAVVVAIGGTTDRPDGSTYHITRSVPAGRGRKATM